MHLFYFQFTFFLIISFTFYCNTLRIFLNTLNIIEGEMVMTSKHFLDLTLYHFFNPIPSCIFYTKNYIFIPKFLFLYQDLYFYTKIYISVTRIIILYQDIYFYTKIYRFLYQDLYFYTKKFIK